METENRELRRAFSNIRKDMDTIRDTVMLQRKFLDTRLAKTETEVFARVEKRFFNGHQYLTMDDLDTHLDEMMLQVDPVQQALPRLGQFDEQLQLFDDRLGSIEKEQEQFLTEKNVQFLVDALDNRFSELHDSLSTMDKRLQRIEKG